MSKLVLSSFLLALLIAVNGDDVTRRAIAILTTRDPLISENIAGHIVFTETDNGLRVYGNVTGLPFGRYSLHVHQLGDVSSCYASGNYFNAENNDHDGTDFTVSPTVGAPETAVFEVSEAAGFNGIALVNFTDNYIALRGERSILGRTLVLHQLEVFQPPTVQPPPVPPPAEQPPAGQPPVLPPPAEQPPAGQPPVLPPPAEQPPAGQPPVLPPPAEQPPAVQPPAELPPVLPPPAVPPPAEQPPAVQPPAAQPPAPSTGEVNPISRIACGVVAIEYPSGPWLAGSAVTSAPSLLVFVVSMLVTLFCFNK